MRTLLLNLCHYRGSTVGLFKKLVVMCFLAISLPVFADPIPDVEWIIKPNTPLIKGKAYHSQDRGAFLIFQRDGNLVLYKVISERTTNPPKSAVYQALWHSNTPIGKYVTKVIFNKMRIWWFITTVKHFGTQGLRLKTVLESGLMFFHLIALTVGVTAKWGMRGW